MLPAAHSWIQKVSAASRSADQQHAATTAAHTPRPPPPPLPPALPRTRPIIMRLIVMS